MSENISPSAAPNPSCETPPEVAFVAEVFRVAYRPDPLLTVSEWADQHRILSQKAASEPGRWRTSRTPYLREPMDCLSVSSPVGRVVVMKGAQVGFTEAGNNWIGYVIHQAPGPMLAVQPTVETAKRNSKQRLAPLIEESPALRGLVKDPRARDSGNTVLAKEFPGGVLVMTGANSGVGLRSMPARYLFLDEIDAYPGDVDGEGDPIALAEARARTFQRRKVFMVSTPTIKGRSRIEREFEASDQRYYFVPCPDCGEYQRLRFAQLRWPKGGPQEARYVCEHCGALLGDEHKTEMLARGEWRATAPGPGKAAGFHLSSLYSPVGWLSWVEIAEAWERAQGDPQLLKGFINTVLGETWEEPGDAPDWQRLYDRRERYDGVPMGGLLLTAGADVHPDRIEVSVWAWGRGKESWLIEHRVLMGSVMQSPVWSQLLGMLDERWPHESGAELALHGIAVDSGHAAQEVYARCRAQPNVMIVKGVSHGSAPVGQPTAVDVTHGGRRLKRGAKVWPVAVGMFKSEFYAFLRQERPTVESGDPYPPGYVHIPDTVGEEWCKQATAEQLITRTVKGYPVREWQQTRDRNEALDCRVYARARAAVAGLDRFTDRHWRKVEEHLGIDRAAASEAQAVLPASEPAPDMFARAESPPPPVRHHRRVIRSSWVSR